MLKVLVGVVAGSIGFASLAQAARAGDDRPAGAAYGKPDRAPEIPVSVDVAKRSSFLLAFSPDDPPPTPRETPPVEVRGQPMPPAPVYEEQYPGGGGWSPTGLREDRRLGAYGQPEWTTERRWARVRSYVIAPGQVEFESWYRGEYARHGKGDTHIFQEEVEIGLPGRFQFDFYLNFEDTPDRNFHYAVTQVEGRWAFADWDCIPWNPTLYLEYQLHDDPAESNTIEAKLLLSKDLAPRWRAGANFVYERDVSGEEAETLGFTAAFSYTVCDERLSIGAEFQAERSTVMGGRDDPEYTYLLGPSVQVRLNHLTHLDIAPLFGLNDASDKMQLFIVLGLDIGGGGGEGHWLNPTSSSSR